MPSGGGSTAIGSETHEGASQHEKRLAEIVARVERGEPARVLAEVESGRLPASLVEEALELQSRTPAERLRRVLRALVE